MQALARDAVRTYGTIETTVTGPSRARDPRIAGERASDVIVMGVRGRGALDVMFFGSNTHAIIRQAECPVLTVRR